MNRGLILDLDNTLYNWVDYFAPCFRAMVHVLERTTQLDEDIIIKSFRRVYQKHGTVEYSFAIQELDLWQMLDWQDDQIEKEAVHPAMVAFGRARNKNLKLYPNVRETLKWARKKGKLIIIGLSDAPRYLAEMRLKLLRINYLFSGLHSWKGYDVPEEIPNEIRKILEGKVNQKKPKNNITIKEISLAEMKPNPEELKSIIDQYDLDINNTYLVGDSIEKDIYLAQKVGVTDIWARYGLKFNPKNLHTLARITHWNEEEIERSENAHLKIKPSYTIENFSDLIKIIGPYQLSFRF